MKGWIRDRTEQGSCRSLSKPGGSAHRWTSKRTNLEHHKARSEADDTDSVLGVCSSAGGSQLRRSLPFADREARAMR